MSYTLTGNRTHDANMLAAELTRQQAQVSGTSQAAMKAADIAFYRTAKTSAIANNIQPGQFISALMELGVGGV